MERLVVYGTLGPGRPNEHIMLEIGGYWEAASVRGKLIQAGWGAEMGFPGLVLSDMGEDIHGFVFTSENLEAHWAALDEFEGGEYERVLAQIGQHSGAIADAYVYALRQQ